MNDKGNDKRGDNWYTIAEAEARLGVSKRTVQRRIKLGEVESKLEDGIRYVKLDVSGDKLGDTESDTPTKLVESLEKENRELQQQIEYFREQITSLQEDLRKEREAAAEASHRHDTVVMQMTRLLEYHQQPFWRKLFSRKALPPPEHIMDMEPGDDKAKE